MCFYMIVIKHQKGFCSLIDIPLIDTILLSFNKLLLSVTGLEGIENNIHDLCFSRHGICQRKGWEKFSRDELIFAKTATLTITPSSEIISRRAYSPPLHTLNGECGQWTVEPSLCTWKNIYIRAYHLEKNWELGRYIVNPVLRGHKQPITCMDCDGM